MKLFVLLYADDTIVLAENEADLQLALYSAYNYCVNYNLTVNTSKTKIIIFSRGKVRKFPTFKYGNDSIEVVSEYVYLGVKMIYNNKFSKAIKKQLDQGRRAQFSMLIKATKLDLPIDIQCEIFENVVFPILLYGAEVWGFQSIAMLEVFYRNFLKKILRLRPSIPNCMVYGEVGVLPLQVSVDKRLINYWLRILNKNDSTFSDIVYSIALKLFVKEEYKTYWLCRVQCILDSCGLSYMWDNQHEMNTTICQKVIHRKIEDIALQHWYTDISNSSMCVLYKLFKQTLHFEKYLLSSNNRDRISLTKFRCSNSKLPVYNHIYMYDSDLCTLCNLHLRGDEFHYVMVCPYFRNRDQVILLY